MNFTKPALLAVALATVGLSSVANAATSTTFHVRLEITSTCAIDAAAATDVNFGPHVSTDLNAIAAGQLSVSCTPGTAYNIALDDGQNSAGGGVTARKMAKGTDLVPYQLYSNSGRTVVWGNTAGAGGNTVSGSGTGAVQNVPVYGRVPSANFPAGTYDDVVTATITY